MLFSGSAPPEVPEKEGIHCNLTLLLAIGQRKLEDLLAAKL